MKKYVLIFISLILISAHAFSNERLFTFSTGLSSGAIIYDSEEIIEQQSVIDNTKKILIGTLAYANFNPIKEVTFFAGTDIFFDFTWNSDYYSNHFSFDFPFGLKIYPHFGGLNFGLAYLLGFRTDLYNTDGEEHSEITPAGNGFKFFIEYNFARDFNMKYLPTLGGSWKCIPRGNYNYDNQICAYLTFNL